VALLELVAFGRRSAGAKLPYFVNPSVDFKLAITALLLLVGVGVLAGLMPALRAAKITPTEAMKAE
jgi:putative ABC transport system permease protein